VAEGLPDKKQHMNLSLKIYLTNWINLLGVSLAALICFLPIVRSFSEVCIMYFFILFYGSIFWIGCLAVMLVLDLLFMNGKHLNTKLFVQWIIISSPFIVLFAIAREWVFVITVLTFAFTQFLRGRWIKRKILNFQTT
jgi:hypothetical protein